MGAPVPSCHLTEVDNADFKRWIAEMVFVATHAPPPTDSEVA